MRHVAAAVEAKLQEITQGRRSRALPWPTFVEVEVRGATLLVGTVQPLYLQWSAGVVNWLLKQLALDATTAWRDCREGTTRQYGQARRRHVVRHVPQQCGRPIRA